jgi:acyl-coenzyme A thioesterase PaaI-like protein
VTADAAPPESLSPSPLAVMNAALEQLVPRAHQMGVRFVEMRSGFVRAEVPFEGNGNHFGTVYAGVTFTLAEVLGGAMHFASFDVSTHYPLVRAMTVDFLAPGRGALSAAASLSDAEIATVRAAAAHGGKAAFVLNAEVTAADGTVVARTRGDYQIRPHGT